MEKIEGIMKSMTFEFFSSGIHKIKASDHFLKEDALFLDVRSNEERDTLSFELIHHMPVIHIPINDVPDRLDEIPKDRCIGVFCSSGVRATIVYVYLKSKGYKDVLILEGGYNGIIDEIKPGKFLKHIKTKK